MAVGRMRPKLHLNTNDRGRISQVRQSMVSSFQVMGVLIPMPSPGHVPRKITVTISPATYRLTLDIIHVT